MRTLAVALLALVAILAGGLWMFAEFGRPAGPAVIAAPVEEPQVAEASAPAAADTAAALPESPAPESKPAPAPAKPRHDLTSKDAAPPPPAAPEATATTNADANTTGTAPPEAATTAQAPALPTSADAIRKEAARALPDALKSAARKLAPGESAPGSPQSSLAEGQPAPASSQATSAASEPEAPAAPPPPAAIVAPAESPSPAPVERRVQTARVAEAAPAEPAAAEPAASSLASDFKSRQVAYNRPPTKLVLGRPVDVSLVINATADQDAAREALEGFKGEIVERDVDLSNIVSAQLTGVGFDIVTQSVERQKLSERTLNRWQWRITPTEPGTHTLILEIFGYESGGLEAEPLDAYRDEIVVEVRELDRLVNLAQRYQPVFAVVAGAAGAISALLALLRFRADRKKK